MWTGIQTKLAKRALTQGEALSRAGKLEAAEKAYDKALRRTFRGVARDLAESRQIAGDAHVGLGHIYLTLNSPERAVRNFEAAHQMQPKTWQPLYWEGCARGWMSDYQGAEDALTKALNLSPHQRRIYYQRGHARFKQRRLDAALADYLADEARGAQGATERLALATLRMQRGEWREAEHVLRKLLAQRPPQAQAVLMLGQSLERQEKWREAAAIYERARQIGDAAPLACERLGVVYTKLEDYEAARQWLQQAMRQGRTNDTVSFYYGWICYRLGKFKECIDTWTQLYQRHPERGRLALAIIKVKYAWGSELVQQTRYEAAIPLWEAYFSARQNDEALAQALAELHLRAAAQKLRHGDLVGQDEAWQHLEAGWELVP